MSTPFYTVNSLGPHRHFTPEGFLVIKDVPLARTGSQLYSDQEVPVKGDSLGRVIVMRDEEEVFRPQTIASLQGKPITIDHPDDDVHPNNYHELSVGHVINPRQGTGQFDNLLIGDLFITRPEAIKAINHDHLREVSVGYDADYEDMGDGKGRQKNIIANHLALVQNGRCGSVCRIGDAALTHSTSRDACSCDECRIDDEVSTLDSIINDLAGGFLTGEPEESDFLPRLELINGDLDLLDRYTGQIIPVDKLLYNKTKDNLKSKRRVKVHIHQ